MKVSEITKFIKIIVTPDPSGQEGDYWLSTVGMDQFDRPELEICGVFFPWVNEASRLLNWLAAESVKAEMAMGDTFVMYTDGAFPVEFHVMASDFDHWEGKDNYALRIVPVAALVTCAGCQNGECEEDVKREKPPLKLLH